MAYGFLATAACTVLAVAALGVDADDPAPASSPHSAPPSATTPAADPAKAKESPFAKQVLAAAAEFKKFDRVSDHSTWSPELCLTPRPSGVLPSASKDEDTHGRKLYFLYAKDSANYQQMSWFGTEAGGTLPEPHPKVWKNPVGQVLVKEAFEPVKVPTGEWPSASRERGKPEYPPEYSRKGDDLYKTGKPTGLFIMLKLDEATPDTDNGWVYATVSADGKTISAAGKIASCIGCHETTTKDRLYGAIWSWPRDPKTGEQHPPVKVPDQSPGTKAPAEKAPK